MFKTCHNFISKNKKGLYEVAMVSLLIIWNIFTVGQAVSTSDNDKVKAAGRRLYECETSVTSVLCMCCHNVTKNKKHKACLTNFRILIYTYLYINIYQMGKFKDKIIYSYIINGNLMLICIELSEMPLFIVNIS